MLSLIGVFRGRVVDVAPDSIAVEITGTEDKIDGLIEVLRPYGLLEMVRTGIVAMRRGAKGSTAHATSVVDVADDQVSYSV